MTKTYEELRATPTHVICEHNGSQRSCPHCECLAADAKIEQLEARVAELEARERELRGIMDEYCSECGAVVKFQTQMDRVFFKDAEVEFPNEGFWCQNPECGQVDFKGPALKIRRQKREELKASSE